MDTIRNAEVGLELHPLLSNVMEDNRYVGNVEAAIEQIRLGLEAHYNIKITMK